SFEFYYEYGFFSSYNSSDFIVMKTGLAQNTWAKMMKLNLETPTIWSKIRENIHISHCSDSKCQNTCTVYFLFKKKKEKKNIFNVDSALKNIWTLINFSDITFEGEFPKTLKGCAAVNTVLGNERIGRASGLPNC
uniref:Uncharacterized protein n=1 Tax=Malurus cyaneus samueli TaxID=2593467 RepID=A0A8C5TU43_9PASS